MQVTPFILFIASIKLQARTLSVEAERVPNHLWAVYNLHTREVSKRCLLCEHDVTSPCNATAKRGGRKFISGTVNTLRLFCIMRGRGVAKHFYTLLLLCKCAMCTPRAFTPVVLLHRWYKSAYHVFVAQCV